jgi:hypothetical protein
MTLPCRSRPLSFLDDLSNLQVPEPWSDPGPLPVIARRPTGRRGDLCVRRQGGMVGSKNFPALFSLHHLPGIDCFAALAMTGRRPQEANAQVPEPWSDPGPLSVIASDRRERGDLCVKRQGRVVGPGYFPEVGSPHRLPDRAPLRCARNDRRDVGRSRQAEAQEAPSFLRRLSSDGLACSVPL